MTDALNKLLTEEFEENESESSISDSEGLLTPSESFNDWSKSQQLGTCECDDTEPTLKNMKDPLWWLYLSCLCDTDLNL